MESVAEFKELHFNTLHPHYSTELHGILKHCAPITPLNFTAF